MPLGILVSFKAFQDVEAVRIAVLGSELGGVPRAHAGAAQEQHRTLAFHAGLAEILLPPVQPGSSIMPGKVNPVIPEVVNQIAYEVIGNDVTVTVLGVKGNQVRIGVNAPKHVAVHREEIYERIQREQEQDAAHKARGEADREEHQRERGHTVGDERLRPHRLVTAERELLELTLRGSVSALVETLALANPTAFARAIS